MSSGRYPAKILLFGEYLLLSGGAALAIPYPPFSGHWKLGPELGVPGESGMSGVSGQSVVADVSSAPDSDNDAKKASLRALAHYIQNTPVLNAAIDAGRFLKEVNDGLNFASNIPMGSGLGSSGALCAAVYERYAKKAVSRADCLINGSASAALLKELKELFSCLESFFHGKSSGLDPLVSWLNAPLLLDSTNPNALQTVELKRHGAPLFIYDTMQVRQTGPLVRKFLEDVQKPEFESAINQMKIANKQAIDALLTGNTELLANAFRELSILQFRHMQPMIPKSIAAQWTHGLESGAYNLKLCGAGGGGFVLGLGDGRSFSRIFLI